VRKATYVPSSQEYHPESHHYCTVHAGTYVQQVRHTLLASLACLLLCCLTITGSMLLVLGDAHVLSLCLSHLAIIPVVLLLITCVMHIFPPPPPK